MATFEEAREAERQEAWQEELWREKVADVTSGRINVVEGGMEELATRVGDLEDGEWLPTPVAYLILGQIATTTTALVGWMIGKYLRGS